jgi:ATP-dependent DNA helicase RecQ
MVFSDRALMDMATLLPQTETQFLAVNGVGQVKLVKHGEAFLKVIRDFCPERGQVPTGTSAQESGLVRPVTRRHRSIEVGQLFNMGQTIQEIAARYGVTRGTIGQHLTRYLQEGGRLDPDRLLACSSLSELDRERTLQAFSSFGTARLAPIYEALSGAIPYEELHLLRLYLLARTSRTS